MEACIRVGEGASLTYTEAHYHGPTAEWKCHPHAGVRVADGGRFITTFSLTRGRVGSWIWITWSAWARTRWPS